LSGRLHAETLPRAEQRGNAQGKRPPFRKGPGVTPATN
jgi:hypothetical protein